MLHIPLTNLLLEAVKQESYKKAYLFMKNIEEFSGKSSEERTSRQKKIRYDERVTRLGRRTREEIAKWNQMTTLRTHGSCVGPQNKIGHPAGFRFPR